MMVILLVFTAVYVPFRIAYLEEVNYELYIIEWVVDCFFFMDIILDFFMAYYTEHNELVTDRSKIIKRYLKTWFLIDVVGCFPTHLLISDNSSNSYGKSARLLRLPRLWKLFKMLRFAKIMNQIG